MPADDTAQMYADVILQHTVSLRSAEITVGKLLDPILHFHTFVEGDLTKIGLLLADLALLPHTGVHNPNGQDQSSSPMLLGHMLLISESSLLSAAIHEQA